MHEFDIQTSQDTVPLRDLAPVGNELGRATAWNKEFMISAPRKSSSNDPTGIALCSFYEYCCRAQNPHYVTLALTNSGIQETSSSDANFSLSEGERLESQRRRKLVRSKFQCPKPIRATSPEISSETEEELPERSVDDEPPQSFQSTHKMPGHLKDFIPYE